MLKVRLRRDGKPPVNRKRSGEVELISGNAVSDDIRPTDGIWSSPKKFRGRSFHILLISESKRGEHLASCVLDQSGTLT
jgi:hypothetical protein